MSKAKSETEIQIGSNLTIDCVTALKEKFDKEIMSTTSLKLSSEEILLIDLAGIQFLSYCNQVASKERKKITMDLNIEKEQIVLLKKNGFTPLLEKILT
jgi:hypothetical protein